MVVYANDVYGLYLSLDIQELGKLYNIHVAAIAIQYEDTMTYTYAAKQVKELKDKYIIVLMHNKGGIQGLLRAFKKGLTGYPYYYLGVDAWLDSSAISDEFGDEIHGFMVTLPWNINTLNLNEYDDEMYQIINSSYIKTTKLLNKWDDKLLINPPRTCVVYAYDVIYSVINTIEYIEEEYGVNFKSQLLKNTSTQQVINLLNDIITNNIHFIGASGVVSFGGNGDRKNGFFSFGERKGVIE